ncbi:MAG TPA: protein kinase [Candidatus Polarisedimenticolaceae bacterium]|nr:protein kinase [Candidatus Polarisedimenticolaceae bacterium]
MPIQPGQRLGPYEAVEPIGAGGMGEVWRAHDASLARDVALKLLPPAFADDPERLARFDREAKVLASLSHPNVAAIFGFHEHDRVRFLAMELVLGEDLAERLKKGPLPLDEAVAAARQIADALEAAHEQGIVHRDLKPANVKLSPDGKVKVLDFGLAKALESATGSGSSRDSQTSPTITSLGTVAGVILGTAAYMSPEQARGKSVDRRADVWAFGCVLYEMLTGSVPFAGETISDTLAAVLTRDPDWSALPSRTPAGLVALIKRCLRRDPRERLRDFGDVRLLLDEAMRDGGEVAPAAPVATWKRALPWAVAAVGIAAALALAGRGKATLPSPARPLSTFGVLIPQDYYLPKSDQPLLDLSADGRTLLFVVEGKTNNIVMKRRVDRMDPATVPGTEGAEEPRLSRDGRWIAFFANGTLRKVPGDGGPAVDVAEARAPRGLAWGPDGSIVYSPLYNSALWRIPPTGAPVQITKLDEAKKERTHRWPQVLPDGKTVIFTVGDQSSPGEYDGAHIDAVELSSGKRTTILENARMARYTAAGYLVYQHQGTLMAARFDPEALKVTGPAFTVQERVGGVTSSGAGFFSLSDDGTLAMAPVDAIPNERVVVLAARDGRETELGIPAADYNTPRVSPDGRTLAIAIGSGAAADDDIYLIDLPTARTQRLTFGQGHGHPLWSRDGRTITYTKGRSGELGFASKAADGSGGEALIKAQATIGFADEWLPDGRLLATDASGSIDVKIVTPRDEPVFASPTAAEYGAVVSPDDRFIAYTSTETGTDEVFVETFPPGQGRWQVSSGGGAGPVWARDGKTIYFVAGETIMAADVDLHGVFRSGVPRAMFSGPYDLRTPPVRNFDVTTDGRFVLVKRKFIAGRPRELVMVDGWSGLDPSD